MGKASRGRNGESVNVFRPLKVGFLKSLCLLGVCQMAQVSAEEKVERSLSNETVARLMAGMVWVEGGEFVMGSDLEIAKASERPAHKVTLDGFYIGKFEVSQELFEEVMGWNLSYFPEKGYPVNNVSWWNIQLFLQRLNKMTGKEFRLPTEAEWEYAAKGGQKSKGYLFSGSNKIDEVAWYSKNSNRRPHPSGKKKPNELGLYDMTGNLWEYCHDEATGKRYQATGQVNPVEGGWDKPYSKQPKITRGGGYEFDADESYVFRRDGATPNVRLPDLGFRLVMMGKKK